MDARDIWRGFDYKAVCLFTGYKSRAEKVGAELGRVGLGDAARLWQFPTPFDAILRRKVRSAGAAGRPGFFNSGMGHYRALKTAYELGAEHSLVMEDDVRFLRDIDLLAEIVADIPVDYDIALLDVIKPVRLTMDEVRSNIGRNMVSRHWCRFSNMRSFACYAMSRRCMARWIQWWESAFAGTIRHPLRIADQFMRTDKPGRVGMDMNIYHAVPNAAIQAPSGVSNSGGAGCFMSFYTELGLDPSSYAID